LSRLVLLTACFAAGILLADHTDLPTGAWTGIALVGVPLALRPRWGLAGAAVLTVAAGGCALALRLETADAHEIHRELRVTLEGTVGSARRAERGVRVLLEDVQNATGSRPVLPSRVEVFVPRGKVPALERAETGERWRLRVRLRPPRTRWNPGGLQSSDRLRRRGIGAIAIPLEPPLVARLPGREPPRWLAPLHAVRRRGAEELREHGRGGALLAALGLGERGALSWDVRRAFSRLGLSHLLAVSGLHLALGAALFYSLARRALARVPGLAGRMDVRLPALALAAVAACAQALLSGWGVPVQRALVLLLATAIAVGRGRPARRLEPLALAALCVLAVDPASLFEVGAQLSFAASAALLLSVPAEAREGRFAWLSAALRAPATAGAVTAPLVARAWGGVAPLGLLANVIAVPWVALVLLPAALLASLVAGLAPSGCAQLLLAAVSGLADLTLVVVEAAARIAPQPSLGRAPVLGWWLVAVAVAVASLTSRSTAARVAAWLVVVAVLECAPSRTVEPEPPRLVVLDVGHGDAIVVQGREGALLVDGALALPEGLDRGERTVLPALAALGITSLDLVVATHADLDHRGGLPSVLRALPVGALWLPFAGLDDPDFAELLAAAEARGVPVLERGRGSPLGSFGDVVVEPIWPPLGADVGSRNDGSLVVRVSVAGSRLLLAGDVGPLAEAAMARRGGLSAEILLLPHHGSRTSSTPPFLDAVDPLLVVASAPCGGRFRTPHPDVVERVRTRALPLWWTGRDGAVIVGLGGRVVARALGPVAASCWADAQAGE
jgi:competence protein ComEC